MRTFGVSKVKNFEFQVEGDDKVYRVPLAAYMPTAVLRSLDGTFESQLDMLRRYMGSAVDDLPTQVASDILRAWSEESKEAGADPGESEASSVLLRSTGER